MKRNKPIDMETELESKKRKGKGNRKF